MLQYLFKRLLLMVPTLAGIIVVSFIVIKSAPGDPASQKFGGASQASSGVDAARGTEDAIRQFRKRWHLDEPLHVQFYHFVSRLLRFDLRYIQRDQEIWPDLRDGLIVSLQLNAIVFVLIYLAAIPLGIASVTWPQSWFDRVSTVVLFMLYSLPSFFVADLLLKHFTGDDAWIRFPALGLEGEGHAEMSAWDQFCDYLYHITLPVVCLTYGGLAYISRQMRAGMLEVMHQDYIRTAEAKGASKARVIFVHGLRNGLFPVITLFASLLPFLIGGSVIIETIFQINGMGYLTIKNIFEREYDFVMATLILSAVMTLLGILLSDILYVMINPQVTYESRS